MSSLVVRRMSRPAARRRVQHRPPAPSLTVELIPDGKRITLVLPLPTPSLNEFSYAHWRVQNRMKKDWELMLELLVGRRKLELKALGKRRLTLERRGVRSLDIDNMLGGAKCVVTDNLRRLGLLQDDNAAGVEFVARNAKPAKGVGGHTVVVLEDLVG